MPLELQIIRAREFIRFGPRGKLNLAASRDTLAEIARNCRLRSINRALLDVRGLRTELTPNELAILVGTFGEIGFSRRQRLALLHVGDQNHRARTFTLIGRLRGWNLKAFDSFEDALMWLSEEKKAEVMVQPEEEYFPVAVKKRAAAGRTQTKQHGQENFRGQSKPVIAAAAALRK